MNRPNPAAAILTRTTRHSPLLRLARALLGRPQPDLPGKTADLLRAASLPDPIAECIHAIVRATRLWKSEQADIARELIAHAHDALAAGQSPQETAANLGDPKTIAPLLRRSARRKRPWHWQARHRTLQAIGISLLAMIGVYTILFIRFNTGSPSIRHNYIAELNERNSAFTADQHALPAFDALYYAWSPEQTALLEADTEIRRATGQERVMLPITAFEHFPMSPTDAPGYDLIVAAHTRLRPKIDAAIAATRLPVLGMLYSDRHEKFTAEDGSVRFRILPPSEDPASAGPMIEVLLPAVGQALGNARLIAFDALLAARSDDADRTADSLTAVFDTARLIGQEHTLIASLVAIAIQKFGESTLLQLLAAHPHLLNETHLTAIAHTAADSSRIARDLDFATEARIANDLFQRIYTDDGRGDGRLTADGVRFLKEFSDTVSVSGPYDDRALADLLPARFVGPIFTLPVGSRREQREMLDTVIFLADASLRAAPSDPSQTTIRAELAERTNRIQQNRRFEVINLFMTEFSRSVETAHKAEAHTNATLTTIALHIHHQRTGQWPETLTELTPHLLPNIPEDPFDPGRPIKYRLIDGMPYIYFIGSDAEDNHATRPTEATEGDVSSLERRYTLPPTDPSTLPPNQGDWIIFPPSPPPSPAGEASGRGPG